MCVISFTGLIYNAKDKRSIVKVVLFSAISLYLLYKSTRASILVYMISGIYLILTYLKLKIEQKTKNKKVFMVTFLIILSIFMLSLFTYQKDRIYKSIGLEDYPFEFQQRRNESKIIGKSDLKEDLYIQYCYMNFSNYSFIYLIENYGKVFGVFVVSSLLILGIKFIINYKNTKDTYGKFLSVGVGSFLFIPFGINFLQQLRIINFGNVNIPFLIHNDMSIIIYMVSISLIMSIYSKKNINAYENRKLNI